MNNDFINTLPQDVRFVFAETLLYLTKVDGKIDASEKAYIKNIVELYNLNDYRKDIVVPASAEEILPKIKATISNRRQGLYLLREMLTLMNVDDDVDDAEIDFVEAVAKTLGIEERKVVEINRLVLDYKIWLHLEQRIMEEN